MARFVIYGGAAPSSTEGPAIAAKRYDTPVRDRKAAATRAAILRALADVITEYGVAHVSVQEVADRAGASHRTVYRHFKDRAALLDGLGGWVREQLENGLAEDDLSDVQDVLDAVPWVFDRFDDLGDLAAAMARISVADAARSAEHEQRTERFRRLLLPALEAQDDPEAIFAVLRHLTSALTWWVARSEFDLDGDRAGRAVSAVIEAVLARDGRERPVGG